MTSSFKQQQQIYTLPTKCSARSHPETWTHVLAWHAHARPFPPFLSCRVISTKPELVAQHLKELTNMLMQKAGFSGKDVQGVVMKLPQLLVAQPSAPEGKLAKLEVR